MKNTDRHYDGVSQLDAALRAAQNHCPKKNDCREESIGAAGACIYYNFDKGRGRNKPDCLYAVYRRHKPPCRRGLLAT